MIARLTWIAMAIGVAMAVSTASTAGTDAKYVGADKCKTCHKKELIGDQYSAWQKSAHAKAFDRLKGDEAKKVAAAKGIAGAPHEAKECLECHATAAAVDASRMAEKPLDVKDGVQCESCHGPGSEYRKKKTMSDHAAAVAAGMWEPGKKAAICTACHNEKSPTWDPAKGFDFEARKKAIAHPIPANVKGRYDAAAKEAKGK
ncbi:MAG: cytochrome c family protein [Myxococcales bacterium]|nr:cytochrome c family protein [Myxococcales bacterium]MDH5567670.1 cytochrome c family protein [Myxococcales bacterium]